ncbi:hypothetical protein JR316_0012663 [Psilocybe cubensis]|uniref:Uncharacterized protein n=1 Tax=Psilocybe cubensis TaxID=181762 RepID=A0ACB8GIL7_PSICU|nr:hypothetical protein JR316_0012663 [Psilocybe cubensis]KAH9475548.1 hypothetical protein JR316_0012663 [Psilocybe cubensis]
MGHQVDVTLVLGPMVFSVVFNAFLYGICVLQFCYYWESRARDTAIIRLLVAWTLLLDTFHTSALSYMIWEYVVVHFNDPSFLSTVLWPFSSTPIVTTMTSFPIQIYLSWRIRQFSRSTRVFSVLVAMAVAQATLGLVCSVAAFHVPRIGSYRQLIPFVDAWQITAVATDVSITLLLSWYLWKSRTGQKSSNNVICRLIRSSIETAAFGASFCILDLITFTLLQDTNFHVVFAFPFLSRWEGYIREPCLLGRLSLFVAKMDRSLVGQKHPTNGDYTPSPDLLKKQKAQPFILSHPTSTIQTLNSRQSLRAELERPIVPDIALDQSFNTFTAPLRSGIDPGPPPPPSSTVLKKALSAEQQMQHQHQHQHYYHHHQQQQQQQQSAIMLNVTVYSTSGAGAGGVAGGGGAGCVGDATHTISSVQICHSAPDGPFTSSVRLDIP